MSILHQVLPFEKIQVESKLPESEILARMNWFIHTQFRGGNLNGLILNGYVKDKNFFFEFLPGNGTKRGLNQYAGIVDGNKTWFFVRLKPKQKKILIISGILILISGIIVPIVDPEKVNEIGKFCGGVAVFYCLIILGIKQEAKKTKQYILQMLEATKIQ